MPPVSAHRLPRALLALGLVLLMVAVLGPEAWAAKAAAAGSASAAAGLVKSASMIGPLGISPFLALAAFGIAGALGLWELPPGLEILGHAAMFIVLALLGLLLQFGRSTKLTKPLAEFLGTGESLFGVAAVVLLMAPHMAAAEPVAKAGIGTGILMLAAGLSALIALVIMRTALDVLIWLSPIPFVDGLFQLTKLVLTLALVGLAVVFPTAALVINVVLLVATAFLVRWALRTARFGATVVYDLTLGRLRGKVAMPRDPVVATDLGPFVVFALDVPDVRRRTRGSLEMDAGRWFLTIPRKLGKDRRRPLGDEHQATLAKTWMGLELSLPGTRVLLPPRYKHLYDEVLKETRIQAPTPGAKAARRLPQAAQVSA